MHLEEHFLRDVVGLRSIRHQAQDHAVDEILVAIDQLGEGGFVGTLTAALDQRAFVEVGHPPPVLEPAPAANVSRKSTGNSLETRLSSP